MLSPKPEVRGSNPRCPARSHSGSPPEIAKTYLCTRCHSSAPLADTPACRRRTWKWCGVGPPFAAGDLSGLASLYTPEVVVVAPPAGRRAVGSTAGCGYPTAGESAGGLGQSGHGSSKRELSSIGSDRILWTVEERKWPPGEVTVCAACRCEGQSRRASLLLEGTTPSTLRACWSKTSIAKPPEPASAARAMSQENVEIVRAMLRG